MALAVLLAGGVPAFASKPGPVGGGADNASLGSFSTPPGGCGQVSQATATFTNTGSSTWSTTNYHLAAVPAGSTTWGPSSVSLPATVAPGTAVTFSWTVTTPSTSGGQPYSWQMANGSTLFGTAISATVTVTCVIGDLFAGKRQLVDDASFSIPATTFQNLGHPGHSDTSTVDLGASASPRYLLFYRTFVSTWTDNNYGIPAGLARATSPDGNTWTPDNGGAPVLPDRQLPLTSGCNPDPNKCVVAVYAPSVIVDGAGLTMAYEVMDTSVTGGGSAPRNWIEAATSSDYGKTWQSITDSTGAIAKVLVASAAWEGLANGSNVGNVGTPDLHRGASGYVVGYHGFDGTHFARGSASGASLLALTKSGSPDFVSSAGWMGTGPGKAADTTEGAYTYRVFEAFNGGSGCVTNDEVGWGLARTSDGVNWTYSSVNPIRTDRVGYSCGEDMPAWQILDGVPHVLVTRLNAVPANHANIRRYAIATTTPPALTTASAIVAIASAPATSGYWEVDSAGGIFNFGAATAFPAASGAGSPFTAATARPAGDGLWLVTASGHVAPVGAATAYGNATVRGGATAVGIESDASGAGYWIVLSTGAIQRFGDAPALTRTAGTLTTTPVAIIRAPGSAAGFWVVDKGGAVASYGAAAPFSGPGAMSAGAVGFGATADGSGGWVVDAGGRIYPVGNATSAGDTTSTNFPSGYQPYGHFAIVGLRASGSAYYLVATDGGVIDFGSVPYLGHVRGPGATS
ncbi:MAG: hypothetical protein NVS1B12_16950 [Acidimicrobiales bacterium]